MSANYYQIPTPMLQNVVIIRSLLFTIRGLYGKLVINTVLPLCEGA